MYTIFLFQWLFCLNVEKDSRYNNYNYNNNNDDDDYDDNKNNMLFVVVVTKYKKVQFCLRLRPVFLPTKKNLPSQLDCCCCFLCLFIPYFHRIFLLKIYFSIHRSLTPTTNNLHFLSYSYIFQSMEGGFHIRINVLKKWKILLSLSSISIKFKHEIKQLNFNVSLSRTAVV